MTEQERRRRRRELERQMRTRAEVRRRSGKGSNLTAFRTYVTAVLTGGCLLISLFHTDTSEMICSRVKEVIAVQMSAEELAEWKNKAAAYFREKQFNMPVFEETEQTEEEKVYQPDTAP